ncbi:alpha/beta hydrolase fold domain-containing protein [Streptacidiphilus sp. N1-12]|uniref:Alpha/beta hydrolase fold domain-containing protein n=2 Tax=Streptacidiphilus alkalitolerans TaxID=3342712 RepID=A0ABV6VCU3_9ACTN
MFHPGVHPGDAERARPALLYFHAGGQVLGSAHDAVGHPCAARMALELDAVLAVVDYRLAPETQAPGAAARRPQRDAVQPRDHRPGRVRPP